MLTLLGACKASPCGDDNLELPPSLAKLPVIDDESSVCIAHGKDSGEENAMVMRWGEDLAPVESRLLIQMDNNGWAQAPCSRVGYEDPDEFCFERGEQWLRAAFERGMSKSMGLEKAAIITHLSWSTETM